MRRHIKREKKFNMVCLAIILKPIDSEYVGLLYYIYHIFVSTTLHNRLTDCIESSLLALTHKILHH